MIIKDENANTMMLVNRTSKLFRNYMRINTDKEGLNDTYRPIIMILSREDNLTQLELVKRTHFSAPSICLTLQKMELEGLIERKNDEEDKRQTRVHITSKGMEFHNKIISLIHELEKEIFSDISLEEQEAANKTLRKIIQKLMEIGGCGNENI